MPRQYLLALASLVLIFSTSSSASNASFMGKVQHWAPAVDGSYEMLLRDATFKAIFDEPSTYVDDLADCVAAPRNTERELLVCVLLSQKATFHSFVLIHERLVRAWELNEISTQSLLLVIDQPIWAVNRLALSAYRPEVRFLFSRIQAQLVQRNNDKENLVLANSVAEMLRGTKRTYALISLHWVQHDQPSSFVSSPASEDQVPPLRRIWEVFLISPIAAFVGIFLVPLILSMAILDIWRRSRAKRNTATELKGSASS